MHHLQLLHSKKWGGLVFEGGPIFSEVRVHITPRLMSQLQATNESMGLPTICGARECVEEQLLVQM